MFFFDKDVKWPFQITYFSSSLIFGYFHMGAKIFKNFSAVKIREIREIREIRFKIIGKQWIKNYLQVVDTFLKVQ